MKTFKIQLLAATAATLFATAGAQAAVVVYPVADIHGNGASSIIGVLDKTQQCLGVDNQIGLGATGGLQTFPAHLYSPVLPTIGNPIYDCGVKTIQPTLDFKYVSTGSGGGRTNWSKYVLTGIVSMPASFAASYADGHVQYAMSDTAITSANLTDYNNTTVGAVSPANAGTGPAIQIPFYLLPVAVAYAPVYGKVDTVTGIKSLSLNVKSTFVALDGAGNTTGGLRMKKTTYCGIMNGTITNWNDAALKTDNGTQSLMDANDDLTRWNTTGVPIKLVGRSDNSGTTNVFTRHLAAACPSTDFSVAATGSDQLPTARKGTAVYNSAGAITAGVETVGKFGLVSGSSGVAGTVGQTIAAPIVGSLATNLGGYLTYIGADFVRPASVGGSAPVLYAAALQQALTTNFKMPTAVNATAAFGTAVLPPESSSNGKYLPTAGCNSTTAGCRANPLSWAQASNDLTKLANPVTGYPIVGTTNLLMYTCYSTPAKRNAMMALASLQFGKITSDSVNAKVPAALVNSTANGTGGLPVGILVRNGIANMPASWKTAILETFFSKVITLTNPASLNLWIQDKLPATTALIDGNLANGEVIQNSAVCPAGLGA